MAFRGVYSAAKPVLGKLGAIVPAGTTPFVRGAIPKVTDAGRGLLGGGVLKTLGAIARPIGIGATALAGTGAAIGLGEYITGMPRRIENETVADDYRLGSDKKGYGDQLNFIQRLLVDQFGSGVDALKDRRDIEEQQRQMGKYGYERSFDNVRDPRLGETDGDYEAAIGKEFRRALEEEGRKKRSLDFGSDPMTQYMLGQNRLQAERMHQLDLRQ